MLGPKCYCLIGQYLCQWKMTDFVIFLIDINRQNETQLPTYEEAVSTSSHHFMLNENFNDSIDPPSYDSIFGHG